MHSRLDIPGNDLPVRGPLSSLAGYVTFGSVLHYVWWVKFDPGSAWFLCVMPGVTALTVLLGVLIRHACHSLMGPQISRILAIEQNADRMAFRWRSESPIACCAVGLLVGSLAAMAPALYAAKAHFPASEPRFVLVVWGALASFFGFCFGYRRLMDHREGYLTSIIDAREGVFHIACVNKRASVQLSDVEAVTLARLNSKGSTENVCLVLKTGDIMIVRADVLFERNRIVLARWLAAQLVVEYLPSQRRA